jgi:hypothetical protein
MRARAVCDEKRLKRILGELRRHYLAMQKVQRAWHVATHEMRRATDVEQNEVDGKRVVALKRRMDISAIGFERQRSTEVSERYSTIGGRNG